MNLVVHRWPRFSPHGTNTLCLLNDMYVSSLGLSLEDFHAQLISHLLYSDCLETFLIFPRLPAAGAGTTHCSHKPFRQELQVSDE